MAKLSKGRTHIIFHAMKTHHAQEEHFVMRSDFTLLRKVVDLDDGVRKSAGWKLYETRIWNLHAKRMELVAKGFTVVAGANAPKVLSEEVASVKIQSTIKKENQMSFDIKAATTAELLAKYNELSGKSTKRFASRAAGEKQVAALPAKGAPVTTPPTARVVKGKAGSLSTGRKKNDFNVTPTPGKALSKLHPNSLRQQLMDWLKDKEKVSIGAIEKHFDRNMRGVVSKLHAKDWRKIEQVAG